NTYPVPRSPGRHVTVGSNQSCGLRVDDPSGSVAGLHARLVRDRSGWQLQDLDSRTGVWLDGARCAHVLLEPGYEIGIAHVALVAESWRTIALRQFVSRLLGWHSSKAEAIDLAMRALRMAETRRAALVLCGAGDLVPVAQWLHCRVLGSDRPFILCDPRRS